MDLIKTILWIMLIVPLLALYLIHVHSIFKAVKEQLDE